MIEIYDERECVFIEKLRKNIHQLRERVDVNRRAIEERRYLNDEQFDRLNKFIKRNNINLDKDDQEVLTGQRRKMSRQYLDTIIHQIDVDQIEKIANEREDYTDDLEKTMIGI